MHLYDVPLIFVLVGLVLYVVLAGADFGAGFWQLLAGPHGERVRDRPVRAEPRRLLGVNRVDVAHIGGIGRAARDRIAAPDHLEPGIGEGGEDLVDARGIGLAPCIAAEMLIPAMIVAHIEAVIGAEHDDGDVGLFVGDEALHRGEPFALGMHQCRAGMAAVEHPEPRVLDQYPAEPASEPLSLAIAKDDDSGPRSRLVGDCRGRPEKQHEKRQPGSQDRASGAAKPTNSPHGTRPPRPLPRCKEY